MYIMMTISTLEKDKDVRNLFRLKLETNDTAIEDVSIFFN